jgi:hypothetical protein
VNFCSVFTGKDGDCAVPFPAVAGSDGMVGAESGWSARPANLSSGWARSTLGSALTNCIGSTASVGLTEFEAFPETALAEEGAFAPEICASLD